MTSYDWSPPYAAVVYLGLALGLVALLLLARRAARSATARSWGLLLVRMGVLAVLLAMLFNPVRVTETRLPPRTPELVYLIDSSRSMALDTPTSRLERVKQVLRQTRRLANGSSSTRVTLYRFGQELVACPDAETVQAEDDATRLLDALERLPMRFGDDLPAGVVIFSDGRTTETTGFAEMAAAYRRLGVPLHVFPVGDPKASGDVAIQDVIAPRDAAAGARVPVRVLLRSHGYEGRRAEVRIRPADDPDRKPLATLPVTLAEGSQPFDLLIDHDPTVGPLVVEVPPLAGEALTENNRVPFRIGARKSKIRVIYMEGTTDPTGEWRFIQEALEENPNFECVCLSVNDQNAVKPHLFRVNEPGRGFPTTRAELFTYDVVICSDIARAAFTQEQIDWTVELVAKRGGGFVMIGGYTSFGSGQWDQTVWDGLIPVDMSGRGGAYLNQTFRVRIPPEAERHPIWRIVDDPVKNRDILDQMPRFYGTNLAERLKPAATALGYSDQPLAGLGTMPVFSCESFGRGRTFAMTTDSTVGWGQDFEHLWGEGDNRYFRKFWRNVILWLTENAVASNRRLRVETDKGIYRPGQPIRVTAHAYDDQLEETSGYQLVAQLRPASRKTLIQEATLTPRGTDRQYEGELTAPPLRLVPTPGSQAASPLRMAMLDVTAYDGNRVAAQTGLEVQVLDDPAEFHDPRPDAQRLEEIARLSGGKVLHTPEELSQLLGSFTIVPGEVVVSRAPLWDHPGLWLLLLGLLGVEWVLRRWWGLA
jgi:uncharacterized membrane protein